MARASIGAAAVGGGRGGILALLMALCFASHLNRVSLAIAADERIMPHYGLSASQMGVVYSVFLLVYTFFMIPAGAFIDRHGPRLALALMGLSFGFFSAWTGLIGLWLASASALWIGLLVVRSFMGFFATPLHPGCARAVSYWVPEPGRTQANGWVTAAALLGVAGSYTLFGMLMDWMDWTYAYMTTGAATAAIAAIWWWRTRGISSFPNSLSRSANLSGERGSVRELLKDRALLLLTSSYAAVGYFQYLFFYWSHYYFDSVLHLDKDRSRLYATLPILAMAAAMPLGGWLADQAQRLYPNSNIANWIPGGAMALSAVSLVIGVQAPGAGAVVCWFTISLGVLGLSEGCFWQRAVELGGNRGGTAAAIMNTGGNGIGLLAPMLTPVISARLGWTWGIAFGGLICLAGAFCWCGIGRRKKAPAEP